MTQTIAHRELRNDSSRILREVQNGASFKITNHGEAIAMLIPINDERPQLARSSRRGQFSDLVGVRLDRPSQEILDELRGER